MSNQPQLQSEESLPFSRKKQEAFLGHLLTNEQLFNRAKLYVQPEWFLDAYCSEALKEIIKVHKTLNKIPTIFELEDWVGREETQEYRTRTINIIKTCLLETKNFSVESILPDINAWASRRNLQETINNAVKLYTDKKNDEAWDAIKRGTKKFSEFSFKPDAAVDFRSYKDMFEKVNKAYDDAVTFGFAPLDRLLNPACREGSLIGGETTVLLAPSNQGKTSTMITIAVANAVKRKRVLFITHEDTKENIWLKLLSCVLGKTRSELLDLFVEDSPLLRGASAFLDAYITYIPMNKARLTVEEVESVIRQYQEDEMKKRDEKGNPIGGYDLLVDDYPAKLVTKGYKGGNIPTRAMYEEIYNIFVQLALEYNFHALLAIQSNREGSKILKGQRGEERLLTMEDVSEAWGPMTSATNVISINRPPRAENEDWVIYMIAKGRGNKKNWAVLCRSNYAVCMGHSNGLGGVWYQSTSTMSDRADQLLASYKDQALPAHEVFR